MKKSVTTVLYCNSSTEKLRDIEGSSYVDWSSEMVVNDEAEAKLSRMLDSIGIDIEHFLSI